MKKIFEYLLVAMATLAMATSCNNDTESEVFDQGRNGILSLNLDTAVRSTGSGEYNPYDNCKVKIFNAEGGLLRRYTALADVPEQMTLVAGTYKITVELGDKSAATLTNKSYFGTKEFTVVGGQTTALEVECRIINTAVAVEFDTTVTNSFADGYSVKLFAADAYSESLVGNTKVPTLTMTSSSTGYFIVPEGVKNICWYFAGTHKTKGEVKKSGVVADVKSGAKYTLTFRYSKDLDGFLSAFDIVVDESEDVCEDNIFFSPDPTIKGRGFEITERQKYGVGASSYDFAISSMGVINAIKVRADSGEWVNCLTGAPAGATLTKTDDMNYTLTLGAEFFASMSGGDHNITFNITDNDRGAVTTNMVVGKEGANPISTYDLWLREAKLRATYFGSSSNVKIAYRESGSQTWNLAATTTSGDAFSANVEVRAGHSYEYKLTVDDADYGSTIAWSAPSGKQIPNAGMENWCESGGVIYPSLDMSARFWDTGNKGASSAGAVLTRGYSPGYAGEKCAELKSTKATVLGIGKFAAGNLFTGEFAGLSGMNGLVDFGQPFEFDGRPESLSFYYRNNVGTVDNAGGGLSNGQKDITRVFICLCKWEGRYRVDTGNASTIFDPATAAGVVAVGDFQTQESSADWTLKTINLNYKSNEKPNYILIVATSSAKGDFFAGSTQSWLYLDEFKLNY